jgi:uncharacterized protein YndB with AHSA1/START domain
MSTTTTSDREIVITRVFDAPRELVFKAWTDREAIGKWFGPNGFSLTIHEMDVRPGGLWRFIMHGPDGTDYDDRVEYIEIAEPERLVYNHGSDEEPNQFRTTITFEEQGGKTRLTMHSLFATAEGRARAAGFGAVEGGNQTLRRLAEYLAKA